MDELFITPDAIYTKCQTCGEYHWKSYRVITYDKDGREVQQMTMTQPCQYPPMEPWYAEAERRSMNSDGGTK